MEGRRGYPWNRGSAIAILGGNPDSDACSGTVALNADATFVAGLTGEYTASNGAAHDTA